MIDSATLLRHGSRMLDNWVLRPPPLDGPDIPEAGAAKFMQAA